MKLVRWSPMWDVADWEKEMGSDLPSMMQGFIPSMDVYQDKDNVVVEAPLPGIKPEDISISIENGVLSISGESHKKSEVDEKNYYRKEVRYGSFHRSVALPTMVEPDKTKAEYADGVLKITVPKSEKAKPKQIKVEIKK